MKNYRVRVETNDGCVTVWYEKSKAESADKLILNRVYNQLCGLNIKEIFVELSV
jgi:IS5 family transposase